MGVAERKGRQRAEREQRIVAAARLVAEREGWGAVTIRRLAEEIEHSQPVLYAHFENRDAIVAAVAVAGFRDLAAALRQAGRTGSDGHAGADRPGALEAVALAYLAFAREHPAVYEAMFTLPTGLRFAQGDTRPELKEAFRAIAAAVGPSGADAAAGEAGTPADIATASDVAAATDVATATETFWAALHGLVTLERSGRIRQSARGERVTLVVRALLGR